MRLLASLGDAFDARNQVLQVLLGLLAVDERVRALLDAADGAPADAPPDDAFTALVLGIVAVAERLRGHLEATAPPVAPPSGAPRDPQPAAPRLRDLLV